MNIVQAYTKFNNQTIILISGFSGSHKTKIAKFVSDLFGFQIMSLTNFFKSDTEYDVETNYVTLKDGTKVLNWDDIYNSVDWGKFNTFVNHNKSNGVVIHGFGFPTDLLDFVPDFHIHVLINKQRLMENRAAFIEKHSANDADRSNTSTNSLSTADKIFFNSVTYPMYIKLNKESKIDEFINSNELSEEHMKDKIFNYLINSINQRLKGMTTKKTGYQSSGTVSQSNLPSHYEDRTGVYDDFYYPDKKRQIYDFNDEGVDYPDPYIKNNRSETSSESSRSSDSDLGAYQKQSQRTIKQKKSKSVKRNNSSDSSESSDAVFLATVDEH